MISLPFSLIQEAEGCHHIDFESFPLEKGQLFFLSPGQVHQIVENAISIGFVISFSRVFLMENSIPIEFIHDLHLFQDCGHTPPLKLNTQNFQALLDLSIEMEAFQERDDRFSYDGLGALLKLFLIRSQQACPAPPELELSANHGAIHLLRQFKLLVEENHLEWHQVQQYSSSLHITADYLNQVVKRLTGTTPKDHIARRIEIAARRLLRFSSLSLKEISFELGFEEPSHFSQFFKKLNGQSPSSYRTNPSL